MDAELVKKNSNEFSVVKEVLNEVNNSEFKKGAEDFYKTIMYGTPDTKQSYIWSALSAVADDVGEVLYEKILNFIDDVADIDTCSIKSLESMV